MIQSEIYSLHRQRHRNKLFVPSKFNHSLQKILIRPLYYLKFHITVVQRMVSVTVSAVSAVCKLILDVSVIG